MNCELPDVQVGFRKVRGIRDKIANISWIIRKTSTSALLTMPKAFDCVDHNKLCKILKEMGIPDHDLPPDKSVCRSKATVRTRHGTTDWFQIWKGVCQGCIVPPCLFNISRVHHAKCRADEAQAGTKIAGRNISNLRYADDTTLMAESKEELLMKVKRRK